MEQLTLEQIHTRCLNIAIEFDKICTKHSIPYYMLGGTMLGAIRHKGFIPWDDDMDFGVPNEYYEQLEGILKVELTQPYRCVTYKDSKSIIFPFFKIEDSTTVVSELFTNSIKSNSIGINIDVFPLFSCEKNDPMIKISRRYVNISGFIYADTMHNSLIRRLVKKTFRLFCPFSAAWFVEKSLAAARKIKPGNMLANIYGRWEKKEIIPIEWYGDFVRYVFDGYSFVGIEQYDKYLKQLYNNYMALPPESDRVLHGGVVFLKG